VQVLVNAGQANAATGDLGMQDAQESQQQLADLLECSPEDILIMSTGVIGRRIKLDAMKAALPTLVGNLGKDDECARRVAAAITTTGAGLLAPHLQLYFCA
jgi:glutamate N-acetyltransferase / amino-acid N-acetyltransferase